MLGIYVPTFNRAAIVRRTVELLIQNVVYDGPIQIHVGVDGTDDTADKLHGLNETPSRSIFVHPYPSGSLGANVNRMVMSMRQRGVKIMMGLDDDHWLVQPLMLDRHVRKLHEDSTAARVHLMLEAVGDDNWDSYDFVATLGKDYYWRVHWDSPGQFLMSFRPHLVHERWWESFGLLPEGLQTGRTEWEYSRYTKQAGPGTGLNVFVPLTVPGREAWHHVGESWNRRGL